MSDRALAPVYLTEHAVTRFRERARRALGRRYSDLDAREKIVKLLARASVERLSAGVRAAHVKKYGVEAEYWISGGWRFVVAFRPDRRVLVTCARRAPGEN